MLNLDGFNTPIVKTRVHSRGGGVGIYVKKGIRYSEIESPFIEGIVETIGIKCKINKNWVIILSVYIPPGKGVTGLDILKNWLTTHSQYIIAGDLNINTKRNTPTSRHYKHFCSLMGLKSTITKIT